MWMRIAIACLALLAATVLAGEQRFADLGSFETVSGGVIADCRVGYRTSGELNADQSNVLVFPTWFGGTAEELERYGKIGPGKLADTDRYYVIAIDALANGVSCSPSNTEGEFPPVAIADMVRSQYELLTKHLGIDHVHAVMGISMGGMQTFRWIGQYPGFMEKAVPIDGSPKMTSYDLIQWQTHRDVIAALQRDGYEDRDIGALVTQMQLLTLFSPDYFVENVAPEDLPAYLEQNAAGSEGFRAADYVAQLDAMIGQDVFADGGMEAYADRVQADVLIVGVIQDHMVNPHPGRVLAPEIGAEYLEVDSNCGHIGSSCEEETVNARVAAFLAE